MVNCASIRSIFENCFLFISCRNGRAFRLVPEEFYERCMPKQHAPEMTRAPLDKVILDTKLLDFGTPKELLALAMDPPRLDNIHKYVFVLLYFQSLYMY